MPRTSGSSSTSASNRRTRSSGHGTSQRTDLLSSIYHAGAGGREVIEQTFADIREQKLHGHEIRTAVPHTVDHSLD